MNKADLLHILSALEDAWEEFDELMREREWYVTQVTDKLESSRQIIIQELMDEYNHTNIPPRN